MPVKVAFVNPRQVVPEKQYTKRVQRAYSEVGQVLPNLSTAYLAGYLEEEGFDVRIIDANVLRLTPHDTARELREFGAGLIGYNLITPTFLDSLHWISTIKSFYGAPTVIGGVHMNNYPEETLSHGCIDFGVKGEGWVTLTELCRALEEGGDGLSKNGRSKNGLSKIRGLYYREDGRPVMTGPREEHIHLDEVPFPARHLLPNEKYTTVLSKRWPITVMLSGSGCPYKCIYCDIALLEEERRAPDRVVEEMVLCRGRLGIREFWFQDENFTTEEERVYRFCEEIHRRGLKSSWSIRTRPDDVTEPMLRTMRSAGCFKIHYGIESGDEGVLEGIGRNIPLEKIRRALAATKRQDIDTLGFFIVGSPGETGDTIKKSIAFALEVGPDFIQVNKMLPQLPSDFYARIVEESGIDYWREYTRGKAEILNGLHPYGCALSNEALDRWQSRFYRTFYFRPGYVWRRLWKIRSVRELVTLVRAALSLVGIRA